jgi:GNAT superfamily N-acetyltransferase
MRLYEFITEAKTTREDFEGTTIEMVKNGHVLVINALDDWGNNVLGSVAFNIGDDNELDPQDLKVDERYQGQGIARVMYDYAKSKGYTIHRSYDQTDAGAGFWNKHRGEDARVWESFDRPYPIEFEYSEYGDIDALTRLPDGTYLSIMFNQESGHDGRRPSHWSVEFYRNNSQEVTGEGDAQKVFATVLAAIQQFVIKMKPGSISFSASKEIDMDADNVEKFNPESRAKLYNRLVQRYAGAMGYSATQREGNGKVTYTLRKVKPAVAENFADGKNPQDKGDSKRYHVPTKSSVSNLRKFAKSHSGRAAQLAHWAANMKAGRAKKK